MKLPKHLTREILRHELSEADRACPCCGERRQEIGVETSEQLELIPARLKVLRHERVKYACRHCEGELAIADKPPQPIEKGLPGPGLCAHTVLSKFGDHQPLYRQEDIHSRLGYTIRRSTLCGWQAALAELALALVLRMKYLVLQSKVIHSDDTSIKMLEPGSGRARTCKFWPYLGDWLHPYAVYDFTLSRERDGPQQFLEGFEGYLQADAYTGYDCIYAGDTGLMHAATGMRLSTMILRVPIMRWASSRDCRRLKPSCARPFPTRTCRENVTLHRWLRGDKSMLYRFWKTSKLGWMPRKTTTASFPRVLFAPRLLTR